MGLNLTFKTVKGAVFHLDFPPDTKVEEVKRKIEETQGESMPAADLVVISQGKILLDETSLADNNITESGFLVVMVKPKAKDKKVDGITAPTQSPSATTAVAQAPQPSQSASVSAPSAEPQNVGSFELLVGPNLEARIAQIVDMGFPRDQVVAAMRAAFNNSERAVEYLMTGIPEARRGQDEDAPAPAPAPAVLPAAAGAPSQTAVPMPPGPNAQPLDMFASQGAPAPGGALDALRSNPQFQTLRQLVQQQPGILEPMLQELARQNPRLVAQINENQAEFLQLLNEPGAPGVSELAAELANQFGGANEAAHGPTIVLSTEDAAAVERLQQLGFERSACIEAYIACDKDEQLAANYLFDSGNDM